MFFGANQFPKEFFDMMEKVFVEKLNDAIRNPAFLSGFSKAVEGGLEGKKKVDDITRTYLEKMHLPSKDDFAHVLQYIQQVESKIITLEEKIEDLTDALNKKTPVAEPKAATSQTASAKISAKTSAKAASKPQKGKRRK